MMYYKAFDGIGGELYAGNFMGKELPENGAAQEFEYFLFVSSGEDYGIEIEKYKNGRVEMYTTIYRSVSDIAGITIPRKPQLVVQHKPSSPEFNMALTHVMQQRSAGTTALAASRTESSPGDAAELEADSIASAVESGATSVSVAAAPSALIHFARDGHNASSSHAGVNRVGSSQRPVWQAAI
jgi:hypothetical protein